MSPQNGKCRRGSGAKPKPNSPSCLTEGSSRHDGQPGPAHEISDSPDRGGRLGRDPGRFRGQRGLGQHDADDRLHHRPGAPPRCWRKGGTHRNGLGRSRGGFTTKLHARSNAEGLAIGFAVTPGQAHDATGYDDLMDDGAPDPETMIGDKGYDSDPIRDDLEERGAEPVIPTKANRKVQRPVDRKTYSLRNRIERFFNKIKNSRRVATRYDKLASSFLGFVQLATIRIWIRFVHAA